MQQFIQQYHFPLHLWNPTKYSWGLELESPLDKGEMCCLLSTDNVLEPS